MHLGFDYFIRAAVGCYGACSLLIPPLAAPVFLSTRLNYVQFISTERGCAHSLLCAPAPVCLSRAKRGQNLHTFLVHTHSRQTRRAGRTARPRWPGGGDYARLACAPCCEQEEDTGHVKYGWNRSLTPAG